MKKQLAFLCLCGILCLSACGLFGEKQPPAAENEQAQPETQPIGNTTDAQPSEEQPTEQPNVEINTDDHKNSAGNLEDNEIQALYDAAKLPTPEFYAKLQKKFTDAPSSEWLKLQATALENEGKFAEARDILTQAEIQFPDDASLFEAFERNYDADPDINAPARQMVSNEELTAIKLIGGGSTLVFKLIKDGNNVAAFKPQQERLQSNYRSEIAAYHFCPLMRCRFNIPRNFHVYFEYNQFLSLYSKIKSNPRAELKDLTLRKDETGTKDLIHGTYKDWIPNFTEFPIELSGLWEPWLKIDSTTDLSAPATDILPAIRQRHPLGDKLFKELTTHLGNLTKKELALQISNMLVFDFLINNWDRFSGVPKFWGINCQFKDGKFMSIDNGAAFPKTANPKPKARLMKIQRFSKLSIDSIRKLDHDKTLNRLFPNPSNFEKERFETFWRQRDELLNYVDGLIATHGAEKVYFFD